MKKENYKSPVIWLVLFDADDIVRTSPNDDGAINGGATSSGGTAQNWWD